MLAINHLNKSFIQGQKKIEVLKELSLSVKEGEKVAILGQSGSGKSTLLALLSGIDKPDDGSMVLEGQELTTLNEKSLTSLRSQKIGIIFQQFHLLPHLSALENVTLPLEIIGRTDLDAAKKALEDVGLGSRLNHYPNQLSGGEKQRVAIARSMVVEPDLLLADEPSGSLDEATGDLVMELIFNLVKKNNKALILVTHNKELAQRCEKVYQLEGGQLHLQAGHQEAKV
jgi:putative ABC transport system ATP-binding protein